MNEIIHYQCRRGHFDKYDYVMEDVGPTFWTIEEARNYLRFCPPIGHYHIFKITITETEVRVE